MSITPTILRQIYRAGILLFMLIYAVAATLYPGGNSFNTSAPGFSWRYNYWCNLLNETALNGQPNPGAKIAFTGMVVLSISLSLFFWTAPARLVLSHPLKGLIRTTGIAAMSVSLLLGSSLNHDLITNLASGLGLIAIGGLILALYKEKRWGFFSWAMANLLLGILNNILYRDPGLIIHLPLVQKISFGSFLLWMLVFP